MSPAEPTGPTLPAPGTVTMFRCSLGRVLRCTTASASKAYHLNPK